MAIEVKVPSLGESITSGVVAAWHVKDGDAVSTGQHLYDLETDKITSEGLAEAGGVIHLKVKEGDEVDIGAVIAEIDPDGAPKKKESGGDGGKQDQKEPAPSGKETASESEDKKAQESAPEKSAGNQLSPAVRRIAEESGIDPAGVEGTGKGGRVTKPDMLKAIEERESQEEKPQDSEPLDAAEEARPSRDPDQRTTRRRMSPLRKRIAEHLVSAQRTAAILTTFNEVDMSAVIALRKKHQESFQKQHGIKLGFMSFFVKATVHALQQVPALNARLDGDEIVEQHFYDIGVAVSTPRGLLVPVVRDCERIGFAEIEKELVEYGRKAKEGKIGIDDLQGGVFTISNGGIFGSLLSTPILNQPQSGILGMHAIKERPVIVDGTVVARPMMYLAVSYDHRIVDGREAVTFLVKIKEVIEDPTRLILGL